MAFAESLSVSLRYVATYARLITIKASSRSAGNTGRSEERISERDRASVFIRHSSPQIQDGEPIPLVR